jgi:hypothetical protein
VHACTPGSAAYGAAEVVARRWWAATAGHHGEPFDFLPSERRRDADPRGAHPSTAASNLSAAAAAAAKSKLSYDVLGAAARQSLFFHQVSLPHMRDPQFLGAAVDRYCHHLLLKQRNPQAGAYTRPLFSST